MKTWKVVLDCGDAARPVTVIERCKERNLRKRLFEKHKFCRMVAYEEVKDDGRN